ncbi:MAG: histidine triad nucleotide-binding protein [Rhodocyclaceae bacterium]|jgi:histidine triad (HIT) family protein|nr:histidine triad nucleotide-binding protein [Rhodocyclaceae bacterium]
MDDCIFCRIVRGEIPARKVFEDDAVMVFHDIHPAAPVHLLAIPKVHLSTLAHAGPEHEALLGRLLVVGVRLAQEEGCGDGFRTIINTGKVGRQEVYHLHVHFLGGAGILPPMLKY